MPLLGIRITRDCRSQMNQGKIESCRLYNEIEAIKRPQAPD
jgi:hypothetical protein